MKKIILGVALVGTLLVGCSDETKSPKENTGIEQQKPGKEYKASLGKSFNLDTYGVLSGKFAGNFTVTVKGIAVEQLSEEEAERNLDKELIVLDVVVKNSGENDASGTSFGGTNFNFYDEKGIGVENYVHLSDKEGKMSYNDLRPGAEKKGKYYFLIDKGAGKTVSEIVVSGSKNGDKYVIKVK